MLIGILSGCGQGHEIDSDIYHPVGYSIQNDTDHSLYFMDRKYVLTADDTKTTKEELKKAHSFLTEYILESSSTGKVGFDFRIDEEFFAQTIKTWNSSICVYEETEDATTYCLTYTKDGNPLTITIYATEYVEYAIVEWTVWIENTGTVNSETISDFNGIQGVFGDINSDEFYYLTAFNGGLDDAASFQPKTMELKSGKSRIISNIGGRGSAGMAPYINVAWSNPVAKWNKEGLFLSVGWSGQWEIECKNTDKGISISAGQQRLSTFLRPGEKIRSPLITLMFWEQDFMRSQNLWRRWLYLIAMPQPNGEPMHTFLSGNKGIGYGELNTTVTEEEQLAAMKQFQSIAADIDAWQMDAGWYKLVIDGEWSSTGTWYADPERFGEDMHEIGDAAAENGWGYILWFEPERLISNSDWYNKFKGTNWLIEDIGSTHMLNLSNDAVCEWLIDFLIEQLKAHHATIYRQDCNIVSPTMYNYWKSNDDEGRAGYTENAHVVNYLRVLDAVAEYLGDDGFIDSCASGGKRMDLETLKRSFVLWRDDACYDPLVTQCHSWSYNFLFPFSGQGMVEDNLDRITYAFRSNMMTSTNFVWDLNRAQTDVRLKSLYQQCVNEFNNYAGYMTGDYYPLLEFNSDQQGDIGWQFNRYDGSEGMIQLFRRYSDTDEYIIYLSGLIPDATYCIQDIDTGISMKASGLEFMQNGITVRTSSLNTAVIMTYDIVD